MKPVKAVLLMVLLLGLAVLGLYLYGRSTCPYPDWYLRFFMRDGNFACVAG